jgi:hypothetical protein
MVVLRATQRVLSMLPASSAIVAASDTALGDWYVNLLVVDRQPLLLLVSSSSLLPLVTPARNVRSLPERLVGLVAARLRQIGVAHPLIEAEVAMMRPVYVSGTLDRSVVGSMVDFAKAIPVYLPTGEWDEGTLRLVEARLARTPCRVSGRGDATVFPEQAAPERLAARWPAA